MGLKVEITEFPLLFPIDVFLQPLPTVENLVHLLFSMLDYYRPLWVLIQTQKMSTTVI